MKTLKINLIDPIALILLGFSIFLPFIKQSLGIKRHFSTAHQLLFDRLFDTPNFFYGC